jgi:hypothetical protein
VHTPASGDALPASRLLLQPRTRAQRHRKMCDPGALAFAPELPPDILGRILALRAGEVATLCAAACVSHAWHDAAMQPRLWRDLCNFELVPVTRYRGPRMVPLTDARLATLVQRALGADGCGLERLDVRNCELITARGVVAALRGAHQEGRLRELRVKGIISDADAGADVIDLLRTFLREGHYRGGFVDVHEHLLCNADVGAPGAPRLCSRLCDSTLCEECGIIRCSWCHAPSYMHDFAGTLPCEHICSDCGCCAEYLLPCERCEHSDDNDKRLLCGECVCFCDTCPTRFCIKWCLDSYGELCCCCSRTFCDGCAFDAGQLEFCNDCSECFCNDCEAEGLKTAPEWAAELQLRQGEQAVDARVMARVLLKASRVATRVCGSKEGDDDEEEEEEEEEAKRICETCATAEEDKDEAEATAAAAS